MLVRKVFLWAGVMFLVSSAFAQSDEAAVTSDGYFEIGIEFQAYPTGLIPGVRIEKGFAGKHAVHARFGYQWIRHRDLGVHDDERGTGVGFTLGYRKYFREGFKGLSISSRCDFWANEIDWIDDEGTINSTSGISKIKVVQPTLELGYGFDLGNQMVFTPTVAFGYEINVKTAGADVGEGAIVLLGFELGRRF